MVQCGNLEVRNSGQRESQGLRSGGRGKPRGLVKRRICKEAEDERGKRLVLIKEDKERDEFWEQGTKKHRASGLKWPAAPKTWTSFHTQQEIQAHQECRKPKWGQLWCIHSISHSSRFPGLAAKCPRRQSSQACRMITCTGPKPTDCPAFCWLLPSADRTGLWQPKKFIFASQEMQLRATTKIHPEEVNPNLTGTFINNLLL